MVSRDLLLAGFSPRTEADFLPAFVKPRVLPCDLLTVFWATATFSFFDGRAKAGAVNRVCRCEIVTCWGV